MWWFYLIFSALMIFLAGAGGRRGMYREMMYTVEQRERVFIQEIERWKRHYSDVSSANHKLRGELVAQVFRIHDLETRLGIPTPTDGEAEESTVPTELSTASCG